MHFGYLQQAVMAVVLLCIALQGNCAPEAASTGLLRARGSLRKPNASPVSPNTQDRESEKSGAQAATEVGILSEGSSREQDRALGLLEGGRNGVASGGSGNMETSADLRQNALAGAENRLSEEGVVCSRACKTEWIGDGWCDTPCNNKGCNFDGGDCEGWCSGDCKPAWLGDGFCDAACYVASCDWDAGDCGHWRSEGVQPVDRRALKQKQKQLKQNRLELPECKCGRRLLVNGTCTPECNVPECLFDGGECLDMCNAKCAKAWLGDGDCDKDCDTAECGYDKGDCDSNTNAAMKAARTNANDAEVCNSSCRLWMIANNVCDTQCNNVACGFDGGDCDNVSAVLEVDYSAKPEVYQFCAKEWIGDGHCDPNCYNKPSKWDGGDCDGTPLEEQQAAKGIGPQFEQ